MRALPLRSVCGGGIVLLALACGDEPDLPTPADRPAAMLLTGPIHPDSAGDTRATLFFSIVEAGYPLDTLTTTDSTAMVALLTDKRVLFVPTGMSSMELPVGHAIRAFAESGGTVVVVGGAGSRIWVDNAFGISLQGAAGFSSHEQMPRAESARSTPFKNGPAFVLANDETDPFDIPSVPVTAKIAYYSPGLDPKAGVVVLPVGSGHLVLLGWNWFDAAPIGTQDGGWNELLVLIAQF